MLGNRNATHDFARIPAVNMARSMFDRSFAMKDIFYFDNLTPIFVDEILPGDTANVRMACFARLATQLVPIMDNLMIDFFFFFVPNRLVWDNWEKFCGSQDNPGDSIDFVIPQVEGVSTAFGTDTIYDKMGIPTLSTGNISISALPFRACNLIWNQWFRDQNMQNSLTVPTDDGPDSPSTYSIQKRNKRHDYFTSCLPAPQRGTPVSLPLGSSAPVSTLGTAVHFNAGGVANQLMYTTAATGVMNIAGSPGSNTPALSFGDSTGLFADLTNATAATINSLRQAIQVQGLLELDARGGTRYVEILQNHFNVTSPDFRLQRPEYLGGGSIKISGHPVAQTAPTSGSNYQGNLAAFSTASSSGSIGFNKFFTEHGHVIGFACPRADITYQQGIPRMFLRSTRYDYFWPKLQELGEQAVLNQEICAVGGAGDTDVFGYQERYAEYRFKNSEIHGQFRSTYSAPLDMWHMAEKFGSTPSLNSTFITQNTPITRALANSSAPQVLFDSFFTYKHARPMMTYSVPVTLGRF